MPKFPFTEVKSVARWTNYSGSLPEQSVAFYCTPDAVGDAGNDVPRKLRRHGDALRAIIAHCFETPGTTLRAVGSRWSFSNIGKPGNLIVDPANLNTMVKVKTEWLTQSYRTRSPSFVPMFIQGGTQIASINRRLLERDLALRTSGAGDGHRLAGCLATGTHGSALRVGAVHDTVLGFHLVTGPETSVFLQPREAACSADVGDWLQKQTGMVVDNVNDDELFRAAQVSLGSLGFVHGVIVETEPLYALRGLVSSRPFEDGDVWKTLDDLQTGRLHPGVSERPFHFECVFHPYPMQGRAGAFVKMYWKVPGNAAPHESPGPSHPEMASDTMGLIASLSDAVDGSLPTIALRLFISEQLEKRYKPRTLEPRLPGMVFGPTSLPPGSGASTEVVVAQPALRKTLTLLFEVLSSEAARGNHLLGAVAVRFVPKTQALLGMNIAEMNAFIELPSIRTQEVLHLYRLWWDALARENVAFTCHWGQHHGMNAERLEKYFGDRVPRWKAARDRLLFDDDGKRVFSSPILSEVGLD